MHGQRLKEHGAVYHRGVALEVVERHVGICRSAELGEQARQRGRQQLAVSGGRRQGRQVRRGRSGIGETQPAQRSRGRDGRPQQLERIQAQTAESPVSPVRMRTAWSMGSTKTLPSPIEPVLAAPAMIETTLSARWAGTTTSILTLGKKSTEYSEP